MLESPTGMASVRTALGVAHKTAVLTDASHALYTNRWEKLPAIQGTEVHDTCAKTKVENQQTGLTGRIAVVTGASRGAGRAIAAALGKHGVTTYVSGGSTRGQP